MNEHIDMKISGSSTMPGGEYGSVSISGAGKVNGSLKCEELHCSGAAKVQGDVDCAGELHTSGAGKIAGSVRCGSLSASGDFSAQSVQVEGLASVSGSLRTERALTADELSASGSLEAGSIHCRAFRASGACRVSGGYRGGNGSFERRGTDRRTAERGNGRDFNEPRGAHPRHRRRNHPRAAEGHDDVPRHLPHEPRPRAHRLD